MFGSGEKKDPGAPFEKKCGEAGVSPEDNCGDNDLDELLEEEAKESAPADNEELLSELEDAKALAERLDEENRELREAIARARADFFNFRQRVEREQEKLRTVAGESAAAALIPVLDNLDRALSADRSDPVSFFRGVEMVRDQFFSVLEDLGVAVIETVGKPFDPTVHEAVAVEEAAEGIEDGTVTEEIQPGYTIAGKVLSAARVRVARRTA